jgi:hypothetical protein
LARAVLETRGPVFGSFVAVIGRVDPVEVRIQAVLGGWPAGSAIPPSGHHITELCCLVTAFCLSVTFISRRLLYPPTVGRGLLRSRSGICRSTTQSLGLDPGPSPSQAPIVAPG